MYITKTIKSESLWLITSSVSLKILQFASILILSRLLLPDDFGLFGLTYAISEMLAIFGDLKIGIYLIFKNKIDHTLFSTALWMSIIIGFLMMVLVILLAPYIAIIFENPLIENIMPWFAIYLFFTITGNFYQSVLQKRMQFKLIAKINTFVLSIGSLLTILLAFRGYGVWSFVIPTLITSILFAALFGIKAGEIPGRNFSLVSFMEIIKYSKHVWLGDVNSIILYNMGFILIAKYQSMQELGFFKFSLSLIMTIVILFQEANSRIFMPIFSVMKEKQYTLGYVSAKIFQYLALTSVPVFILLFLIADSLIVVVFGSKWQPSVLPFKIFCFFGIFAVLSRITPSLLNAIGKPSIRSIYSALFIPIIIISILLLLEYGTIGVSLAFSIVNSVFSIVIFVKTIQILKMPIGLFIHKIKFLVVPLMAMILTVFVSDLLFKGWSLSEYLKLTIQIMNGSIVFILFLLIFERETVFDLYKPLKELRNS